MANLDDHVTLLHKQRVALEQQISSLPEGHRKAELTTMLGYIEDQIQRLKSRHGKVDRDRAAESA